MKNKIGIIFRWIEINLEKHIYLLPYSVMAVSFLYVIIPKFFNIELDYVNWGNGGGFSVLCSILFINKFYFNKKRFCRLTRYISLSFIFISTFNIVSNKYFPEFYVLYGFLYEIIIYSLILITLFILWLSKLTKDMYGNYITRHTK